MHPKYSYSQWNTKPTSKVSVSILLIAKIVSVKAKSDVVGKWHFRPITRSPGSFASSHPALGTHALLAIFSHISVNKGQDCSSYRCLLLHCNMAVNRRARNSVHVVQVTFPSVSPGNVHFIYFYEQVSILKLFSHVHYTIIRNKHLFYINK